MGIPIGENIHFWMAVWHVPTGNPTQSLSEDNRKIL
jgi:hypothetical protein